MMQRISKHFYPENVFDDSTVDQPKLRWRYRNFFVEDVPQSEITWDDSSNEKTDVKPEKTDVKAEPIYVCTFSRLLIHLTTKLQRIIALEV